MIEHAHLPDPHCGCPDCRAYRDFQRDRYIARIVQNADGSPRLARMRAENRPHLRDPAFLKFMGKVVGNTLKANYGRPY